MTDRDYMLRAISLAKKEQVIQAPIRWLVLLL